MIYHWTDAKKALTALKNNKLQARRWAHYLENEKRFAKGTSWAKNATRWMLNEPNRVCFVADETKIANRIHSINGERTYLLTQGLTKKDRDPNAYRHVSSTPDEEFVEGAISPFIPVLTQIWFCDVTNTELLVLARKLDIAVVF
jgi:hypothetical protein